MTRLAELPLAGGINNEFFLFVIAVLFIIFGANSFWGLFQKIVEKRKTKRETSLDEKRLDFEVDKFNIETMQKAIISLNGDYKRVREENANLANEVSQLKVNYLLQQEKNAALTRYIYKAVSRRRAEGAPLIPVDDSDVAVIPEIVALVR